MGTPLQSEIITGADQISTALRTASARNPVLIGRNGTIEMEALFFWTIHRRQRDSLSKKAYPLGIKDKLERHAGIFPSTEESIDAWCESYTKALGVLTGGAAGWYRSLREVEFALLKHFGPAEAFRTPLRSLEPYYVPPEKQWTRLLAGKHVTVVSSFTESIEKQIPKLSAVWTGPERSNLLPDTIHWSFVRTYYAPSTALGQVEWPEEAGESWSSALDWTVKRIQATAPEIVLIGCGGLGMPLAGRLHSLGISSIVLGGAIQVLFGLKGARWESHDVISNFWNDAWAWPSREETPGGAGRIEGFCYWSKS